VLFYCYVAACFVIYKINSYLALGAKADSCACAAFPQLQVRLTNARMLAFQICVALRFILASALTE